jgi:hypothetical protein
MPVQRLPVGVRHHLGLAVQRDDRALGAECDQGHEVGTAPAGLVEPEREVRREHCGRRGTVHLQAQIRLVDEQNLGGGQPRTPDDLLADQSNVPRSDPP